MTAVEALKDVFEEMISVVPNDAEEIIEALERRGFVVVPKTVEPE
jgi:hypothetical protein